MMTNIEKRISTDVPDSRTPPAYITESQLIRIHDWLAIIYDPDLYFVRPQSYPSVGGLQSAIHQSYIDAYGRTSVRYVIIDLCLLYLTNRPISIFLGLDLRF